MIVQQVEFVYVELPQSFFNEFEIRDAGTNANGIVRGYIANTISLGQCNRRLTEMERHQNEQLKIHRDGQKEPQRD